MKGFSHFLFRQVGINSSPTVEPENSRSGGREAVAW